VVELMRDLLGARISEGTIGVVELIEAKKKGPPVLN
jgi:hypothetical protein